MQGHEFNPLSGNQDPICCRVQPKIGNKKNPLPEFTESCFRLLFFATKGHRLESAKRRSTEGRVWESSSQTASCSPLPEESETEQLNCSGVNAWQQAQETDNQRSSPKPCDQSFYWTLRQILFSCSFWRWTGTTGSKDPTGNQAVKLSCAASSCP